MIGSVHRFAVGKRPIGGHRLPHQPHVQVKPHASNVPGLLRTQHVARAPHLQVLHGHRHARTQIIILRNRGQAVVRRFGQGGPLRVQEVRVAPRPGAAHPTPQLVELRQAHVVRVLHNQGVSVGDIQAGFHNGGAHQHIVFPIPKPLDRALQHFLTHLAVRHHNPGLWHQVPQLAGLLLNIRHLIVHKEHLAIPQQFASNSGSNLLILLRPHIRQNGVPILRGRQNR